MLGKSSSGKGGGSSSAATLAALESKLLLIEGRVERIRGEQFNRRPLPVLVGGGEVRREGLADLDRLTSPEQQAAADETLKLFGLIPAGSDLRKITASVYGEQVAGFYDPRSKRLALVKNAGASDEAVGEITLAHELTHALDDQHFGLRDVAGTSDRSDAYTALVEGDATAVMTRYAADYMSGVNLLGALVTSASAGTPRLPQYIQSSLLFPYLEGQRFVQTLYKYGANSWKVVNYAFRYREPVSSAQILHPLEYIRNVKPRPPVLHAMPFLGKSWRIAGTSTFGEFDTRELLRLGMPVARANDVAQAWRGGKYELIRQGPLPDAECPGPCRRHDVLVAAWRTPLGRDAQDLNSALGSYLQTGLRGRTRGARVWVLPEAPPRWTPTGPSRCLRWPPLRCSRASWR